VQVKTCCMVAFCSNLILFCSHDALADTCSSLKAATLAALSGFSAWRDSPAANRSKGDDKIYGTTHVLTKANCQIREHHYGAYEDDKYSCDWEVESPNDVLPQFTSLAGDIKRCFATSSIEEWDDNGPNLKVTGMPGAKNVEIFLSGNVSDPYIGLDVTLKVPK
jgi:hypothetical protein